MKNFKRYLVFAFNSPRGGLNDLLASYEDQDEAKDSAKSAGFDNWQIVDLQTGEIISNTPMIEK